MILAALSSLSLTIMVIFDKLMIKDCYGSDVKQALFVSTFAGSILGLIATGISWLLWDIPIILLLETLWTFMSPYGFLIMLSGALSALVLKFYFTCFSVDADSTVIASWLSATPIFVYTGMYILSLLGLIFEPVAFSWEMFFAVCLISLSLFFLERVSYAEAAKSRGEYKKSLVLMLIFNTLYVLLIDQTLANATSLTGINSSTLILSLLPMYWFGLASGMSVLMLQKDRVKLALNSYLVKFLGALIIVEVLGMLVFFFEFLSLGNTDSITTSIIIGLHVIPVWIISKYLTHYVQQDKFAELEKINILTLTISKDTFSDIAVVNRNALLQLFLVCTTVIGIVIFLYLSTNVQT